MTGQLCENSAACPFAAYQVSVCCFNPQSLPHSPRLKGAYSSCGSGRNTFAHTCALFIFNRCRVEGPVQNGSHLSSINNSATQAQKHSEDHTEKGTHTHSISHAGSYEVPPLLKGNTRTRLPLSPPFCFCSLPCSYDSGWNRGLGSSSPEVGIQDHTCVTTVTTQTTICPARSF